jgi:hypothetical protein
MAGAVCEGYGEGSGEGSGGETGIPICNLRALFFNNMS